MSFSRPLPAKLAPSPSKPFSLLRGALLQRKCACGGTPGQSGECESCRNKKLQRRSENLDPSSLIYPPSSVSDVPPIVHEVLHSSGQPLDSALRSFMEPHFGHNFGALRLQTGGDATSALSVIPSNDRSEREADDIARQVASSPPVASRNGATYDFSNVRVHTDSSAAKSARALNARAYTVGNNIVFADGQYSAGTSVGRELIAHELAHVAQTRADSSSKLRRALHRKTFEANEGTCNATLGYLVRLTFRDQGLDVWHPPLSPDYLQRQAYFRNDFKKTTEDTFNGNTFCIKSYGKSSQLTPSFQKGKFCPCPDKGFKPKLQISVIEDSSTSIHKLDWDISVKANLPREVIPSGTNSSSGTSKLDEADLAPQVKGSDENITQIPAVHEVGHLLGLDHPGAGIGGNIPNEDPEYAHIGKDAKGREVHGPTDLMGEGMGLQLFYFDNWRDELNKKYGDSCGWKVVDITGGLEKPERGLTPSVSTFVAPREPHEK
jgi:hypothetical protein